MTKEEVYTRQLTELGVYNPAFDPAIKTLATMERELRRAQKAWKAQYGGDTPQMIHGGEVDPYYALITSMRKDIHSCRESLGLTPRALQRLKGRDAAPAADTGMKKAEDAFRFLADQVSAYDAACIPAGECDDGKCCL